MCTPNPLTSSHKQAHTAASTTTGEAETNSKSRNKIDTRAWTRSPLALRRLLGSAEATRGEVRLHHNTVNEVHVPAHVALLRRAVRAHGATVRFLSRVNPNMSRELRGSTKGIATVLAHVRTQATVVKAPLRAWWGGGHQSPRERRRPHAPTTAQSVSWSGLAATVYTGVFRPRAARYPRVLLQGVNPSQLPDTEPQLAQTSITLLLANPNIVCHVTSPPSHHLYITRSSQREGLQSRGFGTGGGVGGGGGGQAGGRARKGGVA